MPSQIYFVGRDKPMLLVEDAQTVREKLTAEASISGRPAMPIQIRRDAVACVQDARTE